VLVKPILYTFRRCPYAIRARMAIAVSGAEVETHEVDLRVKPQAMLACSPKGTVPVLQLPDGRVIDESLDIMRWALAINDPQAWMEGQPAETLHLIEQNDGPFKQELDRYKYADRFPQHSRVYYRQQAEVFLAALNTRLAGQAHLLGDRIKLVDVALFPFVRQFAHVDRDWFYASQYRHLVRWLDGFLQSPLFIAVMRKKEA
jgi:glutathione S-transferase